MIKRHLEGICFHEEFGRQMRFISGPRQIGKTTLAKNFLHQKKCDHLYLNWDLRDVRDQYIHDSYFFETDIYDIPRQRKPAWICMDEIHKMPKWKDILKDYFDKFEKEVHFIITGSARLEWFQKSGDALTGRYFLFHLFPLTLSEASGNPMPKLLEGETANGFIEKRIDHVRYDQGLLDQLLNYSGYPEPFTKAKDRFFRRWQREMVDQVLREDIRDLTRIIETENIASLILHLPERIGSPLSLNALREDVQVSYTAVKNAISALQLTHVIFLIPPYSRSIARALKKEKKCYFYDWTRCSDPAARFENYVGVELKTLIELWNDSGLGILDLNYVRTKDGRESDFLITRNGKPWCLIEAKLSDGPVENHHRRHADALGGIPVIQLTHKSGVLKKNEGSVYRISASRFFS
ncbi:MAG: AAA family ATPase [Candidatus Aminicenantes bacterium]|nr:AAA family ATPase [Candidatus Aminicenantes bacterium]